MIKRIGHNLVETSYEVADEAKNASLFGIGNGYFGIRGSFEEFGDVLVQGTYIRGLFDQVVEIPLTLSENLYMKRYYFDEEKLKEFEKEDCCINIGDFTAVRFYLGGKPIRPWTMKIISWRRYIDYRDGSLVRRVVYEDDKGRKTALSFNKLACFHDNHLFTQSVSIQKLNYDDPLIIRSGFDSLVKTNGQHKTKMEKYRFGEVNEADLSFGEKYGVKGRLAFVNETEGLKKISSQEEKGFVYNEYEMAGSRGRLDKNVFFIASMDPTWGEALPSLVDAKKMRALSKKVFASSFKCFDVSIEKDPELDAYLRFSNYQTLIGVDRFDAVHSLSAKNITSERYNQFVWWDCEIFQMPVVDGALPQAAKSLVEYRLKRLPMACENAKKDGFDGAKFAFCSSVKGDENVWIYAKHPFLQIHISSDVAMGLIGYYKSTGDESILTKEGGFQELFCILDYFYSRSCLIDGKRHFLSVTGTDEHHPYVNDDAYTNYEVNYVSKETLRLAEKLGFRASESSLNHAKELADNTFLLMEKNGLVPQFDGYFSLKKRLPLSGKGCPGFQMKANGLYNLSQIIKQPDVIMLYTYLDIDMPGDYKKNWHYYEKMCEASSSLTYPVHCLAALDNGEVDSFHSLYRSLLKMDFDDIYGGAYQGLHAGSLAGGRFIVTRGLSGFLPHEDYLAVSPKYDDSLGEISFRYAYHNADLKCVISRDGLSLTASSPVTIKYQNSLFLLQAKKVYRFRAKHLKRRKI